MPTRKILSRLTALICIGILIFSITGKDQNAMASTIQLPLVGAYVTYTDSNGFYESVPLSNNEMAAIIDGDSGTSYSKTSTKALDGSTAGAAYSPVMAFRFDASQIAQGTAINATATLALTNPAGSSSHTQYKPPDGDWSDPSLTPWNPLDSNYNYATHGYLQPTDGTVFTHTLEMVLLTDGFMSPEGHIWIRLGSPCMILS